MIRTGLPHRGGCVQPDCGWKLDRDGGSAVAPFGYLATIRDMQKRLVCGLMVVLASFGASVAAQTSARAPSPPLPSLPPAQ